MENHHSYSVNVFDLNEQILGRAMTINRRTVTLEKQWFVSRTVRV